MIKPPIPENENERIKALRSLNILDTEAEERFDRITRIAKSLFNVPIALISLVDSDRQWFKSNQGLEATETSRDLSFCGHAILKDEMLIVNDTSKDQRFLDNPFVTGNPNIKFYLGCPLKIQGEYNVGTLCLIDQVERDFTPTEQLIMRDLAAMVQTELESLSISTTDELTGLFNRRGFALVTKHILNLSARYQNDLSLLFFDLDKFKQINDSLGHAEGDKILKIFAKHLQENFRTSDVIARWGGDEFCALCSNFTPEGLDSLLRRLTLSLQKENFDGYRIEYSVGCVNYRSERHHSLLNIIEEADGNMYLNRRTKS